MEIVVYGDTDRRPVTYTLLKLFKTLGDVALLSNDRHYKRLVDGAEAGELESIFVSVGDYSPDDVFDSLEMDKDDFEYVIYDGIIPDTCDLFIHVAGCKMSEEEEDTLGCFDDVVTIPLGYGNKYVPYTIKMFQSIEEIEGYKQLKEVDPALTKYLASILTQPLRLPVNTIRKVVARKR